MSNQYDKRADAQEAVVPSLERRRLLRAAASAAPLIATLPSGAALANGSTAQCIIRSKEISDQQPAEFDAAPSPDNFVRFQAQAIRYKNSMLQEITVYKIEEVEYTEDGEVFDTNDTEWKYQGESSVSLLRLYRPYPTTGPPTTVTGCYGEPGLIRFDCVWPRAKRVDGDNMGISPSCLLSVA